MSPAHEGPATPLPSVPAGYTFHAGAFPRLAEYRHLRSASGLTPMTEAQSRAVPGGSWYGCYITFDGEETNPQPHDDDDTPGSAVAMGRIIGDGGWYFIIADMAVLPTHQRRGLGETVLKQLLAYIRANAPEGDPYVCLTADPPGRKLYRRNGFVENPPSELAMLLPSGWRDAQEKPGEV